MRQAFYSSEISKRQFECVFGPNKVACQEKVRVYTFWARLVPIHLFERVTALVATGKPNHRSIRDKHRVDVSSEFPTRVVIHGKHSSIVNEFSS